MIPKLIDYIPILYNTAINQDIGELIKELPTTIVGCMIVSDVVGDSSTNHRCRIRYVTVDFFESTSTYVIAYFYKNDRKPSSSLRDLMILKQITSHR